MATTTIQINMAPSFTPSYVTLEAAEAGIVAPDAGNRALTGSNWKFTFTATDALVGVYRVNVFDGDDNQVSLFWVWIEANAVATYIAANDFASAFMQKTVVALRKLSESDDRLEKPDDVYLLHRYERQTSDLLIPAKTALQPNGSPLTNVETQRLGGFQEE